MNTPDIQAIIENEPSLTVIIEDARKVTFPLPDLLMIYQLAKL